MDKAGALGRAAGPRKPQKTPEKPFLQRAGDQGSPSPDHWQGLGVPVLTGLAAILESGWAPHIHPWGWGKALGDLGHPGGRASSGRGFQAGAAISGG